MSILENQDSTGLPVRAAFLSYLEHTVSDLESAKEQLSQLIDASGEDQIRIYDSLTIVGNSATLTLSTMTSVVTVVLRVKVLPTSKVIHLSVLKDGVSAGATTLDYKDQ